MKKDIIILFIIIIITSSLLFTGCKKELDYAKDEINSLESTLSDLEIEIAEKDEELKKINILIDNLNILLSTVYYGSAKPVEEGREKNFTGFSMFYKDDFYLITAGHCIEYDGLKYNNFKFKPNSSGVFFHPELLDYNNDYENNRDYAIFSHCFVRKGLLIYDKDKEPKYVLGNAERKINFFKKFDTAIEGESGSPILNSNCKLVGIVIKNNNQYTPIGVVTEAIDKLIENTGEFK